jgi:hypothetical protein
MNLKHFSGFCLIIAASFILSSCNSGSKSSATISKADSVQVVAKDTTAVQANNTAESSKNTTLNNTSNSAPKAELSTVLIYNFHVTNRCVSCIALENATTKTLNTYFANELKQGRIKRQILNVDDDYNKTISMKYQAFGSGLFITRVFKGKETTADLTGDGFKYAKNKEDRFIEILKNQITEYLK